MRHLRVPLFASIRTYSTPITPHSICLTHSPQTTYPPAYPNQLDTAWDNPSKEKSMTSAAAPLKMTANSDAIQNKRSCSPTKTTSTSIASTVSAIAPNAVSLNYSKNSSASDPKRHPQNLFCKTNPIFPLTRRSSRPPHPRKVATLCPPQLETAVDCVENRGIASQTGTWFPGLKQQNSK